MISIHLSRLHFDVNLSRLRNSLYIRALALGTIAVILIAGLSSVPGISPIGAVLLPGMLLAALVFPTGIHSDHATAYMVLVAVWDIVLFSVATYFCLRRLDKPES